jgi:APA family basic amino acid/polyamine antiporter
MQNKKYTRSVAVNMVIANMIGTGIFTTLGYQVNPEFGIPDPFAILMIWLVGGIVSLCGATVYGEIATRVNKSGGEYAFLSEIYHPIVGFVSGWISIVVGFSAAIAALALATGEYFLPLLGMAKEDTLLSIPITKIVATIAILLVVLVHVRGVKFGGMFQNAMTYVKLGLVAVFLIVPFIFIGDYEGANISFAPSAHSWDTIFSLPFAGAMVWVFFAYSGWNASSYIVGSLENPKNNLPFSLIIGTIIVTVLYLMLNFVFMYVATFEELGSGLDLGNIVANKILGPKVGLIFSAVFSLALISGVSAMFIAGPRVAQEIGKDYKLFKALGKQTEGGAPLLAIVTIMVSSLSMVFFLDFGSLIEFTGVTLAIFSLLTVFGIFILRSRKSKVENKSNGIVKAWGYPITPIVFIAISAWMIYYFVNIKTEVIWWFLIAISPAIIIYFISKRAEK